MEKETAIRIINEYMNRDDDEQLWKELYTLGMMCDFSAAEFDEICYVATLRNIKWQNR